MTRFSYVKAKYPAVFVLGYVSFFTDVASEMLYPITPIFLTTIIGTSMMNVGLIEGFADGFASLLKTYAGFWSDKRSKRKPFLFAGYFISAISKPVIGLATAPIDVLGGRTLDRMGKGLRTAPRDAMIADLVLPEDRGLAFGWHRLLDTLGAVTGPLLALILLKYITDIRDAYFFALIPGAISVSLIFFVKETGHLAKPLAEKFQFKWKALSTEFKTFIFGWTIFCLTNSSDAFLILKMKEAGIDFTGIILMYAFYNLFYALLSPSLGEWADRIGTKKVLLFGLVIFILVYSGFAFSTRIYQFTILLALYGVFMASTEGVSKAYVSKLVPSENKASALGIHGTFMGFAQIFASVIAGYLWDVYGAQVALLYSCIGSFFLIGILLFGKVNKTSSD